MNATPTQERSTERGSVTAYLAALMVPVLLATMLAYEGGRRRGAISEARELSESAARAGSQQIDLNEYRLTGIPMLLPGEAAAAAQNVLSAGGATGSVIIDGPFITVTANVTHNSFTASATETSEAVTGITARGG